MEGKANGMRIYISGRISGLTESEYTENFSNYASKFNWGFNTIINPLDIRPLFGIKKYWFYMITDLCHLRKCDTIAMQPNWIDSKGAVIEFFVAKFILKLKVIYL
jgi:hypothetical protein